MNVSKPKKAKKKKLELKEPKGMKDFGPDEMAVREEVTSIIKNVFKRHGAATIQTPVCEQKVSKLFFLHASRFLNFDC